MKSEEKDAIDLGPTPPTAAPAQAINILLVDDEARNLDVLESILQSPDYRLVRAKSADEALMALIQSDFAAIVLDVNMPDMNGFELAGLIKKRKRSRHIPIIFLTAYFQEDKDVLQGYDIGAVDYLTKPANPQILRSKVSAFAELFRTTQALAIANAALEMEIAQRQRAEEALRQVNNELEGRVQKRMFDLSQANAELRESRNAEHARRSELEALMEAAPVAIWMAHDPKCLRITGNRAAHAMLRLPPGENISRSIPEAETLQHFEVFRNGQQMRLDDLPTRKAAQTGKPVRDQELEFRFDDGSFTWAYGNAIPLLDDNGSVRGVVATFVDITERKRTEQALRESEERFRTMANVAPVMIWMSGPDGLCTYVNKPWTDFTGRAAEQEHGRLWFERAHPQDWPRCQKNYLASFERQEPFEMTYRLRRSDNEYRWISDRGVPRYTPDGTFLGYIGACLDITERKESEERFVRLNQTLVSVMGAIPDILFVTTREGRIQFENAAADRFTRAIGLENCLPAPIEAELKQVMETGEHRLPTNFKIAHRFDIDHESRYFLSRVVAMTTFDHQVFGAVVMLQDVTEFRLLDEVKTNMIATVSHELKTPITSLRTALLVLLEQAVGTVNDRQLEMIKIARDETERLLRTLYTLLDLTRFEDNAVGLRLEKVRAEELVGAAIQAVQVAASSAQLTIKGEWEADLPTLCVDRERIVHVLTNLLTNAIKYSPAGADITVHARKQGADIYFSVVDRGPGVPREHHSRLFEKFFRVPGTKEKGIGLGLWIAREFILGHRGRIGVHSEAGEGSEFYFVLPAN